MIQCESAWVRTILDFSRIGQRTPNRHVDSVSSSYRFRVRPRSPSQQEKSAAVVYTNLAHGGVVMVFLFGDGGYLLPYFLRCVPSYRWPGGKSVAVSKVEAAAYIVFPRLRNRKRISQGRRGVATEHADGRYTPDAPDEFINIVYICSAILA